MTFSFFGEPRCLLDTLVVCSWLPLLLWPFKFHRRVVPDDMSLGNIIRNRQKSDQDLCLWVRGLGNVHLGFVPLDGSQGCGPSRQCD